MHRLLRRHARLLVAAWMLPLAGCAPQLAALPEPVVEPYHLGGGDQVRVITVGAPQLSGEFRVNDSGNLAFPLVGSVAAAGLDTGQLEDRLEQQMQKWSLVLAPSVSVEVLTYRPFFILGQVRDPGEYPFQPGMTLLSAVSIGGGFTDRAVTDRASIIRTTDGKAVEGGVGRRSFVKPGDVITIFERYF